MNGRGRTVLRAAARTAAVVFALASCSSSREIAGTSVPVPTGPTVLGVSDTGSLQEYARNFDTAAIPAVPSLCEEWFSRWAAEIMTVQAAAAAQDDPLIAAAVANHQSAVGAALADCIEGRPVDTDDLATQQASLEAALP